MPQLTGAGETASAPSRTRLFGEALGASLAVTVAVTVASIFGPEKYVATIVGFVFLLATWVLVWRKDDAFVERCGLTLGGVVAGRDGRAVSIARAATTSIAWALLFAAVTFVPFFFGFRAWWGAKHAFAFPLRWPETGNDALGQLIVIALPEEAFYRGYLQSRLDQAFAARVRILGANVGPGILVASAIFALGHVATIHSPARLAVFFPSLLFGWLRARTGGIGASVVFHALCNLFSEMLGRGYGVY